MLGTSKSREEARPPANAHDLADVMLRDWRGADVRLGDAWSDNPAVLVFLRHYG